MMGVMLFLVFLKIDALEVLEQIRDFRLMIFITSVYMIIIPLAFYFFTKIFDSSTGMSEYSPDSNAAGVSSPALLIS